MFDLERGSLCTRKGKPYVVVLPGAIGVAINVEEKGHASKWWTALVTEVGWRAESSGEEHHIFFPICLPFGKFFC